MQHFVIGSLRLRIARAHCTDIVESRDELPLQKNRHVEKPGVGGELFHSNHRIIQSDREVACGVATLGYVGWLC